MSSRARERRITLMMGTITAVFILCVAPYFIYFLAPGKPEAKEQVLPYIVMLMYLNSVINPLLYISMNSSVRKATLMMFSCKKAPQFLFGERYFVATAYIGNVFSYKYVKAFWAYFNLNHSHHLSGRQGRVSETDSLRDEVPEGNPDAMEMSETSWEQGQVDPVITSYDNCLLCQILYHYLVIVPSYLCNKYIFYGTKITRHMLNNWLRFHMKHVFSHVFPDFPMMTTTESPLNCR